MYDDLFEKYGVGPADRGTILTAAAARPYDEPGNAGATPETIAQWRRGHVKQLCRRWRAQQAELAAARARAKLNAAAGLTPEESAALLR